MYLKWDVLTQPHGPCDTSFSVSGRSVIIACYFVSLSIPADAWPLAQAAPCLGCPHALAVLEEGRLGHNFPQG